MSPEFRGKIGQEGKEEGALKDLPGSGEPAAVGFRQHHRTPKREEEKRVGCEDENSSVGRNPI